MTPQRDVSQNSNLLRQIGEALHGPQWQSDLSRAIGVSDRSMRRWVAGSDDVPEGVWWDIHRHAKSRWITIKYFDEEIVGMLSLLQPIPNTKPRADTWGMEFAMRTAGGRHVRCFVRREVLDDRVKREYWHNFFQDQADIFYRIARRKFAAGELDDGRILISNADIGDEIDAEEKGATDMSTKQQK